LRCRAVGTCFSQHVTEQNRSLSRPVLHDATVQRMADVPGGISLRHVAQTKLAMTALVARAARLAHFYTYFRICSTAFSIVSSPPRETARTMPVRSTSTVCGIVDTP
jgi:hypothetical protein